MGPTVCAGSSVSTRGKVRTYATIAPSSRSGIGLSSAAGMNRSGVPSARRPSRTARLQAAASALAKWVRFALTKRPSAGSSIRTRPAPSSPWQSLQPRASNRRSPSAIDAASVGIGKSDGAAGNVAVCRLRLAV